MDKVKKFLVLYSEVMPYTVACLKAMVENHNVEVHVVRWDKTVLTPYIPPQIGNINYYLRSELDRKSLEELFLKVNPDIVLVSGWMDKQYTSVCALAKRNNVPVITSADNHWDGSIRQRIGAIYARLFFRRFFDYIMVPGAYQFEFARRIGFKPTKIIFNFYSADIDFYSSLNEKFKSGRKAKYPKNILYLGRFAEVKNVGLLIKAFNETAAENPEWNLILVGNGPLSNSLKETDRIKILPFMTPVELESVLRNVGAFCLPSKKEPWGVVVHEMAACGLPMIVSDVCGAGYEFLRDGLNGYRFASENKNSLRKCLSKIMNADDKRLIEMGEQSSAMAKHISPAGWAAEIYSHMRS